MSNSGLLYANSNSYSRHQSKTFDQPACFDRISPSQNGIKHNLKSRFIFVRIIFSNITVLKFIYSEKATKFWRNLHLGFDHYYIGQIYIGDFDKNLWPSQNI